MIANITQVPRVQPKKHNPSKSDYISALNANNIAFEPWLLKCESIIGIKMYENAIQDILQQHHVGSYLSVLK